MGPLGRRYMGPRPPMLRAGADGMESGITSPWIGVCWHKLSDVDPVVASPFGGMGDGHPASEAVASILASV